MSFKDSKENLAGMIGIYVDDATSTETKKCKEDFRITEHVFESKQREYGSLLFAGIHIHQIDGIYLINQKRYTQN